MSPEDQEAMDDALIQMQEDLGAQQNSFSEREMREALYETYFDVGSAIALLVQEREKEEALAKKRAGMSLGEEETAALRNDTSLAIRRRRGKVPRTDQARLAESESENFASLPSNSATRAAAEIPPLMSQRGAVRAEGNLASTTGESGLDPTAKKLSSKPLPNDTPASSPPPGKKLSKLQQKLQAAKAKQASLPTTLDVSRPSSAMDTDRTPQKQESIVRKPDLPASGMQTAVPTSSQALRGALSADVNAISSVQPHASLPTEKTGYRAPQAPQSELAPSGESITSLFPSLENRQEAKDLSPFVQVLEHTISLRPHPFHQEPVSEKEVEQLRKAFASLSPDDIVLQARRGTKLAH